MKSTFNTQAILAVAPWDEELSQINQRGARVAIGLVLGLYPLFGVLDYVVAPESALPYLFGSRVLVVLISLFMLKFTKTTRYLKSAAEWSAGYMFLVGAGITFMITFMGGLSSPYYAGLNLVMLGCGLLFVWPNQVSYLTHASTFCAWLVANTIFVEMTDPVASISNGFFLFATACIVSIGQSFNYKRLYQQHLTSNDLFFTQHKLYRAHKKLKQIDSFKSRFFANITHELKTPLALILSSAELLLRAEFGPLSPTQSVPVSQMQRHGVKLLKLINDLLDMTKIEESRLHIKVKNENLSVWARTLVTEMKPLAERKGITLEFESKVTYSETLTHLYFDSERMERVLVNLLSNATKFTEAGGHIKVSVWAEGERVQLSVADTGRGFTAEQAEHLFDRFYQTDMGSNRKYGGTGLGLALSQELVELHGGQIFAAGEEGVGATFTVSLKLGKAHFDLERVTIIDVGPSESDECFTADSEGRSDLMVKTESEEGVSEDVTQVVQLSAELELRFVELEDASERRVVERDEDEHERAATVLIAEDNPDIVRLLHLGLRRHFKVVTAENGKKALEMIDRFNPSLVITDLMMPEMDGMELTKHLKTSDHSRGIPVLMLSAKDGIEEEMERAGFKADAYMAKPFSTRALCKLAKSLVAI